MVFDKYSPFDGEKNSVSTPFGKQKDVWPELKLSKVSNSNAVATDEPLNYIANFFSARCNFIPSNQYANERGNGLCFA